MPRHDSCKKFAKWNKLINDQQEAVRSNQTRHDAPLCNDLGVMDYIENQDLTRYYEYVDHYDLETYKYSNEVPVNKSFHVMGLCQYDNAPMDVSQEGRYLREYCVQRAGANHFLHFKTLTDLRSSHEHHDPEKLMNVFANLKTEDKIDRSQLPYDVAYKWAQTNRSMNINRKFFIKMVRQDMMHLSNTERIEYIELITDHSDDMDRHTMEWINYINANMIKKAEKTEQMELLSDYFTVKEQWHVDDEEDYEYWEDKIEELLTGGSDDELDRKDSSNPYSSNRLYNGNESLSYEFQRKIETADMKTIRQMQANMFPQKRTQAEMNEIISYFQKKYGTTPVIKSTNPKQKPLWKKGKPVYDEHNRLVMVPAVSTGLKYKPPVYNYFTKGMVSHFWELIKLRKEQLNQETVDADEMSENLKAAIGWVQQLGKGQLTCTIINNAINGEKTNAYGIQIEFTEKLNRQEANTLWAQYKSL
jgi:hypothetical protein